MFRSVSTGIAIILLAAGVVFVNGISRQVFTNSSLDLTEDGLYSLSSGSKEILASLDEPITLRYYFSKTEGSSVPSVTLYGERILNLLKLYEAQSKGMISLNVYDPRSDSEEAEWAEKFGMQTMRLRTGQELYLGLVATNSSGVEEVIPLLNFSRQETLEYDITKLIYSVTASSKPKVAVISSLEVGGGGFNPMNPAAAPSKKWFAIEQLEKFTDLTVLAKNEVEFPLDTEVLVLIHPKEISEALLYQIDQHVMRGGRLAVFVDPYANIDLPVGGAANPMAAMNHNRSSNLNQLLSSWGIESVDEKVAGDIELSTKVTAQRGMPPVDFVTWVTFDGRAIESDNTIVSDVDQLMLPWPGYLKLDISESKEGNAEKGYTIEPLLSTTTSARSYDVLSFQPNGGDPNDLLRTYTKGGEALVIAAISSGKFKTNYPDGNPMPLPNIAAPGQEKKPDSKQEHVSESTQDSSIIVVADVDFLADSYSVARQNLFGASIVSLLNDNVSFLHNIVDNLGGSSTLMSIRTRGRFSRPFDRIKGIETAAQVRWQQQEAEFQAKLSAASQRLQQIQGSAGSEKDSTEFSMAMLDEIKELKREKLEAQQNLRKIRRNARSEVEEMETHLFLINTFLVPLFLIVLFLLQKLLFPKKVL